MKLIYLREANLRDNLFVRDLVINFKWSDKVLLLHDTFAGTIKDTRFVTKRLSSLFSESMIYNNAFYADQRDFFVKDTNGIRVNVERINELLQIVQLLIIGPIIKGVSGVELANPQDLLYAAQTSLDIDETIIFPNNPKSPLVAKKLAIPTQEEANKLISIYEEETETIKLGHTFSATLASPMNYAK